MNLNQIVLFSIKVLTVIIYGYTYLKYKSAKGLDPTLKFVLKGRSMIEFYLMLVVNVLFMFTSHKAETAGFYVFVGAILFLITYIHLERILAVGRKVLFTRMLAFDIRQIKKRTYQRGKFTFYIQNGKVDVRLPVADMTVVMQMLSGRRR